MSYTSIMTTTNKMPSSWLDDSNVFTMPCDVLWLERCCERLITNTSPNMTFWTVITFKMNILKTISYNPARFNSFLSNKMPFSFHFFYTPSSCALAAPSLLFYSPTVLNRLKDANSEFSLMFASHICHIHWIYIL